MTEGRVWLRAEPLGSPGILVLDGDDDGEEKDWEEEEDDWDDDDEDEDDWEDDEEEEDWDEWEEDDEDMGGRKEGGAVWNLRAA
jgi:hypothetical protein